MTKLLVIEDDLPLNHAIVSYLLRNGFQVLSATSVSEGYADLQDNEIDLIISDIMLPGIDGFEMAQTVRKINQEIPILFISALGDMTSKRRGFSSGIDDYLVKPFELDELILRVEALLRRSQSQQSNETTLGDIRLEKEEMSLTIKEKEVILSPKEFKILEKLLERPKKIFTRSELLDDFWGATNETTLRSVDVYIAKLRKVLADSDSFEIQTVHGYGYKGVVK